jgi:hypothetical protein
MNNIDMKAHVIKAIQTQWPSFAANHPHLAAAVDQTLLIEQGVAMLADDPEYQHALLAADASTVAVDVLSEIVSRIVARWLGKVF